MWGFGKQASPAASSSRRSGAKASSNSTPFLDIDVDAGVGDGDLDLESDAALLAELDGLRAEMGLTSGPTGTTSRPNASNVGASKARTPAAAAAASINARQPAVKVAAALIAPPVTSTSLQAQPVVVGPDADVDDLIASLPGLGLGGGEDDEDDVHVELTEADLNDPALLGELLAVAGDGALDLGGGEDGGQHEFLESHEGGSPADMLKLADDQPPPSPTSHAKISTTQIGIVATPDATAAMASESILSLDDKLRSSDPSILQKYLHLEKMKAISKKRAGDKAGTMESLRVIKALEVRYDALIKAAEAGRITSPSVAAIDSSDAYVVADVVPSSAITDQHIASSGDFDEDMALESVPDAASAPVIDPQVLNFRVMEYKRAALAFKKKGDMTRAREMLSVSKSVQDVIEGLEAGRPIPANYSLPPPPPSPSSTVQSTSPAAPATPVAVTPVKREQQPPSGRQTPSSTPTRQTPQKQSEQQTTIVLSTVSASTTLQQSTMSGDVVSNLRAQLETQIAACTSSSAYYFKAGKKDKAVEIHKLKKTMQADLVALATMSPTGVKLVDVDYEVEITNSELGMEEMEVQVVRAFDVSVPTGAECYVGFDIGWPVEEARAGDGRGKTGAVSASASPEFGFSRIFKIERTRAFQRYLERRRAVFDVYHVAKGSGGWTGMLFAAKPVNSGRASVRMDSLLNKCEIHEVFELVDANNPRKVTGGRLEVKIRVRIPLSKHDVVSKKERWMFADFSPAPLLAPSPAQLPPLSAADNTAAQLAESRPTTPSVPVTKPETVLPRPVAATVQQPAVAVVQVTSAAAVTVTAPATTTATATTAATAPAVATTVVVGSEDLDDMELQFLNPETISSNQVLEAEHGTLIAQIAALQASRKAVPEELSDRKMGYELRMNMLVTLVQIGTLTMPDYIKQVKGSIAATKRQALAFKNGGKADLAKQAMKRIKLMTDEVEEVERAIANGDM